MNENVSGCFFSEHSVHWDRPWLTALSHPDLVRYKCRVGLIFRFLVVLWVT